MCRGRRDDAGTYEDGTGDRVSTEPEGDTAFECIVESTGHAIYVTDPDGTITYVNPAFEEITGYTAEESIGQTPAILNSGEQSEEYFAELWETITAGNVWEEEVVNRRKNGDRYAARQTISPVVEDGEITQFVAIQTDVTEQKERKEALERNHELLAQTERLATVGGWEIDLDTNDLRWTDGTRRLHEVPDDYDPSVDAALGFYHPEDRGTIQQAVEKCRNRGISYDVEARLVTAEGRIRWIRARGKRTIRDDTRVLQGAIIDITSQKHREERLMVLNRVLRHNLKNDLNVVIGYADFLREELAALESDEATSLPVEKAQTDAQHIKETAQEIVEIADKARTVEDVIEQYEITDTVDLCPLVEDVAAEYRDEFPAATIEVDGNEATALGNVRAFHRVVQELLENALKHDDRESPTVTLEVTARGTDLVCISVADTGPGIPDMERDVIEQGEETPLMHGSGIGLWLVNWLVTGFGGTVVIDDNEPRGTIVTVEMPAA